MTRSLLQQAPLLKIISKYLLNLGVRFHKSWIGTLDEMEQKHQQSSYKENIYIFSSIYTFLTSQIKGYPVAHFEQSHFSKMNMILPQNLHHESDTD